MEKQIFQVFKKGAIPPKLIGEAIASQQSKTQIGAHDIFLGQVRADVIDGKKVAAIEYSAYEEMANIKFNEIRENTLNKFEITDLSIYHSLGIVKAGEICLFVFVTSPHRRTAFDALQFCVEEIKALVPVFGKELFEDDSYQWKVNT